MVVGITIALDMVPAISGRALCHWDTYSGGSTAETVLANKRARMCDLEKVVSFINF